MSLGFPARWALVCALVSVAGAARAEDRRAVAVVDLSGEEAARNLRNDVYAQLQIHWALKPLRDPSIDSALVGSFVDEDRRALDDAASAKAAADEHIVQFRGEEAVTAAKSGMSKLATVSPTKVAALAVELAIDAGSAELGLKHQDNAIKWFALVRRLDPARKLDPVRYEPEVVATFKKAEAVQAGKHALAVKGTGRVWIDGVEQGAAPGSFDVEDGFHLVQLAGPARETRGRLVQTNDPSIEIEDAPASQERLVQRARLALKTAPEDAVARAPAMKQLAELLGVHDAVLIWKNDAGRLVVQTWRDRAPGFSALREHTDEPPLELLAPLSPPKPPEVTPPPEPPPKQLPKLPHVEDEPPWYRRTWVQATVAGGVAAAVIGAVVWARHEGKLSFYPNTQWGLTW